jgi:hypothetical protein
MKDERRRRRRRRNKKNRLTLISLSVVTIDIPSRGVGRSIASVPSPNTSQLLLSGRYAQISLSNIKLFVTPPNMNKLLSIPRKNEKIK